MKALTRTALLLAAVATGGSLLIPAEQPLQAAPTAAKPAPQGKQVFDHWCAPCHADDARAPGTTALAAKYGKDQPAPLEQRKDLTPDLVTYFVRHGVSIMPSFRKTEISDAELAALGNYLSKGPAASGKR